ncbi:MAG: uroporphyrinogen decarboxylase family protein [Gemmatimonadota bacterium]
MERSIERVRAVIRGEAPDRAPLYELIRNDGVINHFTGETLTVENGPELVYRAYEPAVDATRPSVRPPGREEMVTLPDGRAQRHFRWTIWTEPRRYADAAAYAADKRRHLDAYDASWSAERQRALEQTLAGHGEARRRLGQVFYFPGGPGPGLMGIIGEVGLEAFCYYLADLPGLVDELLACQTESSVSWIDHLPAGHGMEAVFCGDDIAFKTGPLLAPAWFETHYLPHLARVCAAYHRQGIRVLFHSDGNLLPILDGLVDAGIDGLNPLEVLAGMDPGLVHRRHPRLFLAGGIDVSQLLPYGTVAAVREAVRRALGECEGRLMVGSSTELNNEVPLANFLALREAVLDGGW